MLTKILRDLNAERPEGMSCGLVILYENDGDDAQTKADSATLMWFRTHAELNAAWDVAREMSAYMMDEPSIKKLDELPHVRYAIMGQTDDDGYEEDPYIGWAPADEFNARMQVATV